MQVRKDYLAPYRWAKQELGECEIQGSLHNRRILFYHSFALMQAKEDEVPWCSSFMCAASELSGYPSTKSAAAKSWENYGVPGDGSPGDIALFNFNGSFHVAFVNSKFSQGSTLVECLGGNQGNKVSVVNFKSSGLVCFRRFP